MPSLSRLDLQNKTYESRLGVLRFEHSNGTVYLYLDDSLVASLDEDGDVTADLTGGSDLFDKAMGALEELNDLPISWEELLSIWDQLLRPKKVLTIRDGFIKQNGQRVFRYTLNGNPVTVDLDAGETPEDYGVITLTPEETKDKEDWWDTHVGPEAVNRGQTFLSWMRDEIDPDDIENIIHTMDKAKYRHEMTDYDDLLSQGYSKEDAREAIQDDMRRFKSKILYHGSPYLFDSFDTKAIGSGEGANMYGWGLYFTENPELTNRYSPRDLDYEENLLSMYKDSERRKDWESMEVLESAMLHSTLSELREMYPDAKSLIDKIERIKKTVGFRYTVELDDSVLPYMLKWDYGFEDQTPAIKEILQDEGVSHFEGTGGHFYVSLADGDYRKASEYLSALGIRGTIYEHEGTTNYVVFDERDVQVLRRE